MPFAVRSQPYGLFGAPPFLRSTLRVLRVLRCSASGPMTSAIATEPPWPTGESPKLQAAVKSHPNVEKHDVRMGHPATPTFR